MLCFYFSFMQSNCLMNCLMHALLFLAGRLFCTVGVHPTRCKVFILVLAAWLVFELHRQLVFYLGVFCLLLASWCCVGVWRDRWSGRALSGTGVVSQGGSSVGKGIFGLALDSDILFLWKNSKLAAVLGRFLVASLIICWLFMVFVDKYVESGN